MYIEVEVFTVYLGDRNAGERAMRIAVVLCDRAAIISSCVTEVKRVEQTKLI